MFFLKLIIVNTHLIAFMTQNLFTHELYKSILAFLPVLRRERSESAIHYVQAFLFSILYIRIGILRGIFGSTGYLTCSKVLPHYSIKTTTT